MKQTRINGKYNLLLPDHRADRPEWQIEKGGWEVERIDAMMRHIQSDDIVFDIGTEEGDITALIAKYTHANMVLFEPNDRVWPCIRVIWEANQLQQPLDFYRGFLSDKTTNFNHQVKSFPLGMFDDIDVSKMIPDHGFKQLYENYRDVPQMTMDDYCKKTGLYPTVITMDVEGAEWSVIKGAQETLRKHKPVIFMSVHPEFLFDSYRNEGVWKEKFGERCFAVHMIRYIVDTFGYKHSVIEWDWHEIHVRFDPK